MVKFTDLIVLFIVILSLLFPHLACKTNDTASYQADNVTLLAKNISPDCPAPEDPNACA